MVKHTGNKEPASSPGRGGEDEEGVRNVARKESSAARGSGPQCRRQGGEGEEII